MHIHTGMPMRSSPVTLASRVMPNCGSIGRTHARVLAASRHRIVPPRSRFAVLGLPPPSILRAILLPARGCSPRAHLGVSRGFAFPLRFRSTLSARTRWLQQDRATWSRPVFVADGRPIRSATCSGGALSRRTAACLDPIARAARVRATGGDRGGGRREGPTTNGCRRCRISSATSVI